jgi:hypothetical protein
MTTFHVLNGDCLAEQLRQTKLNNNHIICRECLIDGEVFASNLTDFWKIRAKFITQNYNATEHDYFEGTVKELEQLNNLPENSEVCLWFENDLFCQANMWFVMSLISKRTDLKIYRVFPIIENQTELWKGFGNADVEKLEKAYAAKVAFEQKDIDLGVNLWAAYQKSDFIKLKELSKEDSTCFQYLAEVCEAHIDRFNAESRPKKLLKEIIKANTNDFDKIFAKFSEKEGIYGFGDSQIKSLLNTL